MLNGPELHTCLCSLKADYILRMHAKGFAILTTACQTMFPTWVQFSRFPGKPTVTGA
mgnify:CR=1 FL=1